MKGFSYPFSVGEDGPEMAEDEELVAAALTVLLSQSKGERPFQETNGVDPWRYVFDNANRLAEGGLRRETMLAIARHEPRARGVRFPIRVRERDDGSTEVNLVVAWQYQRKVYTVSRPMSEENRAPAPAL